MPIEITTVSTSCYDLIKTALPALEGLGYRIQRLNMDDSYASMMIQNTHATNSIWWIDVMNKASTPSNDNIGFEIKSGTTLTLVKKPSEIQLIADDITTAKVTITDFS